MRGLLLLVAFAGLLIWWVLPPSPPGPAEWVRDLTADLIATADADLDKDQVFAAWAAHLRPLVPRYARMETGNVRVRREMQRFYDRVMHDPEAVLAGIQVRLLNQEEVRRGDRFEGAEKLHRVGLLLPAAGLMGAEYWSLDLGLFQRHWMVLRAPDKGSAPPPGFGDGATGG